MYFIIFTYIILLNIIIIKIIMLKKILKKILNKLTFTQKSNLCNFVNYRPDNYDFLYGIMLTFKS